MPGQLGIDRFTVWVPGQAGLVLDAVHDQAIRCVVVDLGSLPTREEQSLVAGAVLGELWRRRQVRRPAGPGSEDEADTACSQLVQTVAAALPGDGVILDVGNGLGTQDPVIAEVLRPRRLVAVNITEGQLSAGRAWLREAAAAGVAGDAARLPVADQSIDGVISIEAAFHFRSRRAFFDECFRVLKPGGALSISDIATERLPLGPWNCWPASLRCGFSDCAGARP